MSAISVIVLTPRADDRWLKLESLQIEILQFFIMGKVSAIDRLSKGIHLSLNFEFNISFKIFCSSFPFPVAKKNLLFLELYIFYITVKKVFEGTLLVGPEPPIPKSMFCSFLSILNFEIAFLTKSLQI